MTPIGCNSEPVPDPTTADLRRLWDGFCDDLKAGADHVLDPDQPWDATDRTEGLRHLLRSLARGVSTTIEGGDHEHPELAWVHPMKFGQDNPDGLYQAARVDLSHTYRLSGNVGSVRYLGFTMMSFDFDGGPIEQLLNLNGDQLGAAADGGFSVVFSPDPPPPGSDDDTWFQLPAHRSNLMVRQFFGDWEAEVPADLHLECIDPGPAVSRLDPDGLSSGLRQLLRLSVAVPAFWTGFGRRHLDRGEVNTFGHVSSTPESTMSKGGSPDQSYGQCWWRVAEDEALLYEVEVPECSYWGVQLGDVWYQSLDWVNRQSSLNGQQAVIDDGVFRAVISHREPGIANWLDTTGASQGCITYRWNQSASAPVPSLRLVPFDDVADHLPADTARLTPDERAESLRRRRRGALRRFRR
jgi:hypothetical protein